MKKFYAMALTALILGTVLNGIPAFAQTEVLEVNEEVEATKYIKFSGVITEISENTLIVENADSLVTHFPITEEVQIYNSGTTESIPMQEFKKGMSIEAYYDGTKPMILIYPPVITPEVVIAHDEENQGQVKVDKFDENLVSFDGQLQLNVTEETVLEEGVEKADLHGKELLVFYTVSTKSIPAQTTPTKVIILDEDIHLDDLVGEDYYLKNNKKMIPLRKMAEQLDYEVLWQEKTRTVLLKKQNQTFLITPDEVSYGFNKSLRTFKEAPEIINGTTYVSEELLEMLTR